MVHRPPVAQARKADVDRRPVALVVNHHFLVVHEAAGGNDDGTGFDRNLFAFVFTDHVFGADACCAVAVHDNFFGAKSLQDGHFPFSQFVDHPLHEGVHRAGHRRELEVATLSPEPCRPATLRPQPNPQEKFFSKYWPFLSPLLNSKVKTPPSDPSERRIR